MSRTLDRALGEFDKMPSVAGDPVVESGSNSDGEWTRWADGTQKTSNHMNLGDGSGFGAGSLSQMYRTNIQNHTFPQPFVSIPKVSFGTDQSGSALSAGQRFCAAACTAVSATGLTEVQAFRGTDDTFDIFVSASAFGYWK